MEILGLEGLPDDQYHVSGPELRVSWGDGRRQHQDAGQPLVWLRVRALQSTVLSEALSLQSDRMHCEAYTSAGRRPLLLHIGEAAADGAVFFAPRPNPFGSETTFEVVVKESAAAHLEIFDLSGRRVWSEHYTLEPGLQAVRLRAALLPSTGVYLYRLSVGEAQSSGRLVRLE
jgi:hypothetical protein